MACLVAAYAIDRGRGVWAAIEPLLIMRPPCGCCLRMMRNASRVQRKAPVKFTFTTACHSFSRISSSSRGGPPIPALLKSRSTRPCRVMVTSNRLRTESSSLTSVGTGSRSRSGCAAASSRSGAGRRPASTTSQPSAASAVATPEPIPVPAPVTTAILLIHYLSLTDLSAWVVAITATHADRSASGAGHGLLVGGRLLARAGLVPHRLLIEGRLGVTNEARQHHSPKADHSGHAEGKLDAAIERDQLRQPGLGQCGRSAGHDRHQERSARRACNLLQCAQDGTSVRIEIRRQRVQSRGE